jgi:class 3 adenylate cyclase/Tfp pilus assembly protein PilF
MTITIQDLLAPLEERFKAAHSKEERTDILNEMSFSLRFRDTARALQFANDALLLAETADYTLGVAQAYLSIGFAMYLLSRNEEGLSYGLKSLYAFENLEDEQGTGRARLLIGSIHWSLGNYDQALSNAMAGVKSLETTDDAEFAGWAWNIMGGIHQSIGDTDQAVAYFDKALQNFKAAGNVVGEARIMNGLALALETMESYEESLEYSTQALIIHRAQSNALGEARSLNDIGSVYHRQGRFQEAIEYHEHALQIRSDSNNRSSEITSLLNLGIVLSATGEFSKATNLLLTALDIALEIGAKPKVCDIHHALSEVYERAGNIAEAFEHYKRYHAVKEDVLNNETASRLRYLQTSLATEKVEQEAALERQKNKELAEANAEIQRQMAILDEQATEIEVSNAVLEEKNLVITQLHDESERLLLNVLPAAIAVRLKSGERAIADHYDSVTVLFADIVGFTKLSQTVSARDLVEGLNGIFGEFDALAAKHGLEKIKTIGDAYMVAGGLPERSQDHTERVAHFALAMQHVMNSPSVASNLGGRVQVRIGIHTGEAVAGVIGTSKFAYDIWGDTVNTASRMESHGEAGKIHVSEEVFLKLNEKFMFEERGEMEVKGKGVMRTWFLVGSTL